MSADKSSSSLFLVGMTRFGKWLNQFVAGKFIIVSLVSLCCIFLLNVGFYRVMNYLYEEHLEECSLNFVNVPNKFKYSAEILYQRVTAYWMYNPSIVELNDNRLIVVGRMSWQYGTDCGHILDKKLVQYCILAHSDKWRDSSVVGEYNPDTCSVDVRQDLIKLDDWGNGTGWFDTKLYSSKSLYVQSKDHKRRNGFWITAQKSEMISKYDWRVLEGDQKILYQMLFMAYDGGKGGNSTKRFTRAVYHDPDPTHWSKKATDRYVNNVALPEVDFVTALCGKRPPSLPPFPKSSLEQALLLAANRTTNQTTLTPTPLHEKSNNLGRNTTFSQLLIISNTTAR